MEISGKAIFKRLAYTLTVYCLLSPNLWRKRMLRQSTTSQNIVLDKSYAKQLGQMLILEYFKR